MQTRAFTPSAYKSTNNWTQRMAASALKRYSLSAGRWHYQDGLLFKGIWHVWQKTKEPGYWQNLATYIDHYVTPSGDIKTYSLEEFNLDQINAGKLLFPLLQATKDERYRQAIERLRAQLRRQPRTNEGGFWHKQIYPYQMWLDGIYMGAAFYTEYAATFDEPTAFDDIALQVTAIEKHTRDPKTGLLYHAWDERHQQKWADPISGCSPHFWSRAIGWYCMAIVDILDHFPQEHTAQPEFVAILARTLGAIARVQDQETGLWWQVLDQSNREGNYLEASGTCMFIYAIAKGVRNGYLEKSYIPIAQKGFRGLLDHLVTTDDEGQINLHGICASAGLGGEPYRAGTYNDYINEPVATNDLHGVGAFILAANEIEEQTSDKIAPMSPMMNP